MIEPQTLQQVDRTYVRWAGREFSYFSGCDYFRLSSHAEVKSALIRGLKCHGLNVAASRMTTGNHPAYGTLEKELARFFKTEAALLVPSGYVTNLVAAQTLSGQFSHALIDELAHPSLHDAANILQCPVLTFGHRSVPELTTAIARCGPGAKLILLTDGMFARDGSVAPLREYQKALPGDGVILVDDAHGAGVLGANGRGALEHARANSRHVIHTITLSKAFGVYGGVILCSTPLRKRILERSRLFIGSTPLPLPLVEAGRQALKIIREGKSLRRRLNQHTRFVREALTKAGVSIPETPGPIIAFQPGNNRAAQALQRALRKARIYPPLVYYPGGPAAGYFRFVISSEHTRTQLDNLVAVLTSMAGQLRPLV
ncbi:MAG TPA: aminotransferase class I/II-fold pyridoxal phosphate-dependent enzyme [Verrucomicrobiae bacterium]|nr:aminotransferase class I/II-fold pyridoxal phosphate-dependent enzyme [Verrucomicrobiae bacterium]